MTYRTAPGQLTVAELIEKLRDLPGEAPAMIAPEMGPGQATSARSVVFEHGHAWITGEPTKPWPGLGTLHGFATGGE